MVTRRLPSTKRRDRRPYRWVDFDDDALLAMRMRDLRLRFPGSLVEAEVESLYRELDQRGVGFKPHVWLSEEWFSPDGVPGIAIPFFVAHPRLRQLERRMMGDVDGGNARWRLRLLRHEAGHALDTAYGLRRRADWRMVFGPASTRYPGTYVTEPSSRRHVLHVGHWYAQSHPTEDFAETFAVWLTAESALAPRLRRLARAREARIRRLAHGADRRREAARAQSRRRRTVVAERSSRSASTTVACAPVTTASSAVTTRG